jgi:hypothetical protein
VPINTFPPNSGVNLTIRSNPTKLATIQADSNGGFSTSAQLPKDLTSGEHELFVIGTASDGSLKFFATTIFVKAIPGQPTPPCSGELSGTINGGLTIKPNLVCILDHATVNGSIVVDSGAVFLAVSSRLNGGVIGNSPDAVGLCGDQVNGSVTVLRPPATDREHGFGTELRSHEGHRGGDEG